MFSNMYPQQQMPAMDPKLMQQFMQPMQFPMTGTTGPDGKPLTSEQIAVQT